MPDAGRAASARAALGRGSLDVLRELAQRGELLVVVLEALLVALGLPLAPGGQDAALLVAGPLVALGAGDLARGALLVAVDRGRGLAVLTELRQRFTAVLATSHARIALAVLGAALAHRQRVARPEALEDGVEDRALGGGVDERGVGRPVDLRLLAHVQLGQRAEEHELAVHAHRQALVAQRAGEGHGGGQDRLLGGALVRFGTAGRTRHGTR